MRRKKRFLPYLIVSILSFAILIALIFMTSPHDKISVGPLSIYYSSIVLLPLLSLAFFLPTYFFKDKIHGALLILFIFSSLFLTSHGLTHPFFFLILLALFLTLELLFAKKRA